MIETDNIKFSVIMVCYNSAKTIEQAIISVLQQSYTNVEFIIIDGGSKDGTKDIIQKYQDKITYWESEPDTGIYNAMNKGIRCVTGDVISFLNSDDWYEKDALEKVAKCFRLCQYDVLAAQVAQVMGKRRYVRIKYVDPYNEDIHFKVDYHHQGIFAKKSVFDDIGGFNEKYRIAADYDWILRVHNSGRKIYCAPNVVANFRMDGLSIREQYKRFLEYQEVALSNIGEHGIELKNKVEKYYEQVLKQQKYDLVYQENWSLKIDILKKFFEMDKPYYIWGIGYYGEICYELLRKINVVIEGFIDNNYKNNQIYGFDVLAPENIKDNTIILVSTFKYEVEIVSQLVEMGVQENRIVKFSEIQKNFFESLKMIQEL